MKSPSGTRRPRARSEGSALIVTLGVLALLSLLAFTFASLASLERRVSRNYVDLARARLLAQSGIDYALFRLRDPLTPAGWSTYRGEDWNGDWVSTTVPGADAAADDANGNQSGICDTFSCPLRYARRPSFWEYPGAPALPLGPPTLVTVDEGRGPRLRGITGRLPGTYNPDGDHYVVRARDCTGQIFVNDQNPNIATIINYLAIQLGLAGDCGTRIILDATYGRQARFPVPATSGFPMKDYLYDASRPLVAAPLTKAEFDRIEGYLAVHAWVDNSVVKPKAQFAYSSPPAGFPIVTPGTYASTAPGYRPRKTNATLPPIPWDYTYRTEPRAPVNVNEAARPVLIALIQGLTARIPDIYANSYAYPADGSVPSPGWCEGYRLLQTAPISSPQAQTVADRIISYREGTLSITYRGAPKTGPIGTWEEFNELVAQRLVAPAGPLSLEQGSVLMANANPNTRCNKFNPDRVLRQRDPVAPVLPLTSYRHFPPCDKTDLMPTGYSTEFCFSPHGYYEIASMGRVLGDAPANRLLAQAEIRAVVKLYEVMRHTTEKDFVSASVTSQTQRMGYYPEHPEDRGFTTMRTAGDADTNSDGKSDWNPGPTSPLNYSDPAKPLSAVDPADSELDGYIGIASVYQTGTPYWYMQLWNQLPGANPVTGQYTQIGASGGSGTWYFINVDNAALPSYHSRDDVTANSASPTSTDPNNKGLFRAYPNMSDLAQDGLIISADRYRHVVMSSVMHNYLAEGAAELWIKPKTDITPGNNKGYWWEQQVYQGPKTFNVVTMGYVGPGWVSNPGYLWPYAVPQNWWGGYGLSTTNWGYLHTVNIQSRSYLGSSWDSIWYDETFIPTFSGTLTTPYNTAYVPNSLSYVSNTVVWGDPPRVTNSSGPKWHGGHWYRMMLRWSLRTEMFNLVNNPTWDSTAETQVSFMDPDLYLDGAPPLNYQKRRHFNNLLWPYVYVGGYWVEKSPASGPPDPRGGTTYIHYVALNGDPQYGNKLIPGSNFQRFNVSPFGSAWNNWNLDPFCEGTMDEVRIWNAAPTSTEVSFPGDRYFPPGSGAAPVYVGQFYRRDTTGATTVKWDDDPSRTFPAGVSAKVRSIAYTEYRPRQDYTGVDITEGQRPNFDLSFRKPLAGFDPAPSNWDGRDTKFSALIGAASDSDPRCIFNGSERLEYRVQPVDNRGVPVRVTPFFDDITVIYDIAGSGLRFVEWYYAAD